MFGSNLTVFSSFFFFFFIIIIISSCTTICLGDVPCQFRNFDYEFDDLDEFTDVACTFCLRIIHFESYSFAFKQISQWEFGDDIVRIFEPNSTEYNDYHLSFEKLKNQNRTKDPILREFRNDFFIDSFLQCCQNAHDCCQRRIELNSAIIHEPAGRCPMIWDGWDCWNTAPPNTVSHRICPQISLIGMLEPIPECLRSESNKECLADGTWNQTTDYHPCSRLAYRTRATLSRLSLITQSISMVFLIISLILFIGFGHYNKFRIQLHLNFFLTIILSSLMAIFYDSMVTKAHLEHSQNFVLESDNWCRAFTFLYKNTRLINFAWMLIEGLFFHNIVVFTFNTMSQWPLVICGLGWTLPNVIMIFYAVVRIQQANDHCWTDQMGQLEWIYVFFPYFCFAVNLVLFINLIRVILHKLVFAKHRYPNFARKGMRTALFLIPIFGLQYLIYFVPVDATETCDPTLISVLYIQTIIEGLQGTIVAIILCFLDKEVYKSLRKFLGNYNKKKDFQSSVQTMVTKASTSS